MRSFSIVAFLAYITAAAAQAQGLPQCAGTCVGTDFGGCGSFNVTCICSNKPLIDNLACCVSTACNAEQQTQVINFANGLCAGNGVTDLPQSATCASGASSGTATASASGSSTAAGTSATTTGTGAAASSTGSSSRSSSGSASSAAATPSSTGSANKIEAAAFGIGALVFGALAAM
ncbi:CFEM domain-containing protein 3 [Elsinoe australis]|uniref:CFEM domain-containing protein 3 n=1 Tax=Elsinoe australis TaxID=40998 RepID=A0A4U7B6T7_9PEZI|nr:CFEM domain-containing protein 3 [Elsinoe australis]